MVEIFKTNVENRSQAGYLIRQIHRKFSAYRANFDLEDCDRILRITCDTEPIQPVAVIKFLGELGILAEAFLDNPEFTGNHKVMLQSDMNG